MNSYPLFENEGAYFSEDRTQRFALWRIWDDAKPLVMFIGLNPSTANETEPDNTIRRVIRFATEWGYGGVYMMNLFTIVSSNPEVLKDTDNWGSWEEDQRHLTFVAHKCERIIFAWGNFKEAQGRSIEAIKQFPHAYCLKKNKNGSPIHPLYVKADTKPIKY